MTARLTPAVLAGLRERAKAATPGPWKWDEDGFMGCGQVFTADPDLFGGSIAGPSGDCYPRSGYRPQGDMKFIAAADPQTVEALVDEVEALREALDLAEVQRENDADHATGMSGRVAKAEAEVEALRAVVARVEALVDQAERRAMELIGSMGKGNGRANVSDLRAALAPAETTGAGE